jgi:hypothetical protein
LLHKRRKLGIQAVDSTAQLGHSFIPCTQLPAPKNNKRQEIHGKGGVYKGKRATSCSKSFSRDLMEDGSEKFAIWSTAPLFEKAAINVKTSLSTD